MSEDAVAVDLKGGHPPATKVGGMRVVQHKKEVDKNETPAMTPEEEAEFGPSSPPKTDKHHQALLVSGVVTKGDKDFTAQAVRSFHEKPLPHHDERPRISQVSQHIQQPK